MSIPSVFVIARKEFRDVLRDRRTLIFMMLLPIAVMPLMMIGATKFITAQKKEKEAATVKIVVDGTVERDVQALARSWIRSNGLAFGVLNAKLGLEIAAGSEGFLDALLRRAEEVERQEEAAETLGTAAAALKASAELTEEEQTLLSDASAVNDLLQRTEFVPYDEVPEGGELSQGIEIPEDAPAPLDSTRVAYAVQNKDVQAAIHLPAGALALLEEAEAAVPLHVMYDSSQSLSEEAYDRVRSFVTALNRHTLELRLADASLPRDFAEPLVIERANVATASRQVQAVLGGILPYMLFAFCFFGALYPALDVTAGEKERFTLETLLLGPVSRLEIALGKFVVVFVAAITAGILTTASMAVTFTHGVLPADVSKAFEIEFQPLAVALTASLLVPVAALFAAVLLAVGVYARSFKEAQSYTVPLQFVFILPMLVAMIPDVETKAHLAWIPFVNIAMLTKELLKGNVLWGFYVITLGSTLLITFLALLFTARMFRRESVLLRT